MVISEHTQSARTQEKMLPATHRQPDPSRGENAQNMTVGKYRDVTLHRTHSGNHSVHASTYVFRTFAARASIAKDQPAWCDLLDLVGRESLVPAVVPLDKVGVDDHVAGEACQFAGLSCSPQWAGKNKFKLPFGEDLSDPLRKPSAVIGQRDIGDPRVLSTQTPRGLPVADRK